MLLIIIAISQHKDQIASFCHPLTTKFSALPLPTLSWASRSLDLSNQIVPKILVRWLSACCTVPIALILGPGRGVDTGPREEWVDSGGRALGLDSGAEPRTPFLDLEAEP